MNCFPTTIHVKKITKYFNHIHLHNVFIYILQRFDKYIALWDWKYALVVCYFFKKIILSDQ